MNKIDKLMQQSYNDINNKVIQKIAERGYENFTLQSIGCNHEAGKTHLMNAKIYLKDKDECLNVLDININK